MSLRDSLFMDLASPVEEGLHVDLRMTKTMAAPEKDRPDRLVADLITSEGEVSGQPVLELLTKTKAEPERDRPDRQVPWARLGP